jgi:hypothetical protein
MEQRPDVRDSSVWERSVAKTAMDYLLEQRAVGVGCSLMALGVTCKKMPVLCAGLALLVYAISLNIRRPSVAPPVNKNGFIDFDTFDGPLAREYLGFDFAHLQPLFTALRFPARLKVGGNADPTKDFFVCGKLAFLFMLYRVKNGEKLTLSQDLWGYQYSVLSRIYRAAEMYLVDTHGHLLEDLAFFVPSFEVYNTVIQRRITKNRDVVPPEGRRCVGFLDRTSVGIARPDGDWAHQQLYWNKKSKMHCLAYQSLIGPDGMIMHFWGPMAGRHNDNLLLGNSDINQLMMDAQTAFGILIFYWCYTDRGYANFQCVRAAHHGLGVTLQQNVYNAIMTAVRVTVEWGFGKVYNMGQLITQMHTMKLQETPVNYHVKSVVLLCNAHTCLYGSNTSKYFGLKPPDLYKYFDL